MHFKKITRWDSTRTLIIGELEWREGPGKTYEVHIDVHPDHQRRGIGRSMVASLESWLVEPMSLYTFMAADNAKARMFFVAVGFDLVLVRGFYGRGRDAYFGCKTIGEPK